MPITHAFTSAKSEGGDPTLVGPNEWNAAHTGNLDYTAADGDYITRVKATGDIQYRLIAGLDSGGYPQILFGGGGYNALCQYGGDNRLYIPCGESSGLLMGYYYTTTPYSSDTATNLTYGVTGIPGSATSAVSVSGTGYVRFPYDSGYLDLWDSFFIEFWIKRLGGIGTKQFILDKGLNGSGVNEICVFIDTDNKVYLARSTDDDKMVGTSVAITDTTTWHYVCFSKHSSTSMQAFLDNVDVSNVILNYTMVNTSQPLYLFQDNAGANRANLALCHLNFWPNYQIVNGTMADRYLIGTGNQSPQIRIHRFGSYSYGSGLVIDDNQAGVPVTLYIGPSDGTTPDNYVNAGNIESTYGRIVAFVPTDTNGYPTINLLGGNSTVAGNSSLNIREGDSTRLTLSSSGLNFITPPYHQNFKIDASTLGAAAISFGDDLRLYRSGAGRLTLDDNNTGNSAGLVIQPVASGSGYIWGTVGGGGSSGGTELYLWGGSSSSMDLRLATDTQTRLYLEGDSALTGLQFGSGSANADVRLYRSGVGTLIVDSNGASAGTNLAIRPSGGNSAQVSIATSVDSYARATLTGDSINGSAIMLGPGNAAPDLRLYRSAAKTLTIDDTAGGAATLKIIGTRLATPSSSQTLSAGTALLANAEYVMFTCTGTITTTAAPTVADGSDGQVLILMNVGTGSWVIKDQGTLTSSNLRLMATSITIAPRQSIELMYSATVGDWVQTGALCTVI